MLNFRPKKKCFKYHDGSQDGSHNPAKMVKIGFTRQIGISFCVFCQIFFGKWSLNKTSLFKMRQVMKKLLLPYANNKGADQPAHPRSLISTFVVRCPDSKIPLLAVAEISRLSEIEQAGLNLTWSKTPKTGFLMTRLKCLFKNSAGLFLYN